jgi:hypothetical protein
MEDIRLKHLQFLLRTFDCELCSDATCTNAYLAKKQERMTPRR